MARSVRILVAALLLADAAALLGVQGLLTVVGLPLGAEPSGTVLAAAVAAGQLIGLAVAGAYRPAALFAGHREYAALLSGLSGAAIAVAVIAYLWDTDFSRPALLATWAFSVVALGVLRFSARRLVYRLRQRDLFVERVLVVGADAQAVAVASHMDAPLEHGLKVAGFLDDYRSPGSPVTDGLAVLAEPRALLQVARREGVSRVVVVPQALTWESMRDLLETAARDGGLRMQMAPALHQLLAWSRRPVQGGPIPLIELENLSIRGWNAVAKRTLDLILAGILLPALTAELALAWACARLDGGGPLVRRRTAVGRRGHPLPLLALARPKSPQPPGRLRRIAWRLRWALAHGRWSKLPNLANVLMGRMSLVGPRALPQAPANGSAVASARDAQTAAPERAATDFGQLSRAEASDTWLLALSSVRPGLTGPTAATDRGASAEEQAIQDVAYIRDYSLWLDLRLLFASARRAMRRERALPASYPALAFGSARAGSPKEAP